MSIPASLSSFRNMISIEDEETILNILAPYLSRKTRYITLVSSREWKPSMPSRSEYRLVTWLHELDARDTTGTVIHLHDPHSADPLDEQTFESVRKAIREILAEGYSDIFISASSFEDSSESTGTFRYLLEVG